jgi:AcrR family transcriptional regulator
MPRAGLDREAVVAAAAGLADAEGLPALTLARLADALGVRPPSLYAHVDGLEDLRRRLALRAARELTGELRAAVAGRARGDALSALAWAYRAYAHRHPGIYAALQRAPDAGPEAAFVELVEVVTAVLRGYRLQREDAVHAVRIIRAALHGFVALELEEGFGLPLDLDETFARMVVVLDQGMGRKP